MSNPKNESDELALTSWFKNATRLVIIGIGHPLRGDDGVGPWITNQLEQYNSGHITAITAYNAPENLIVPIIRLEPSHLLIIDAAIIPAKMEKQILYRSKIAYVPAGTWDFVDPSHFKELTLSTHSGTMHLIINFLKNEISTLDIRFLVIHPQTTTLSEQLSKSVHKTATTLLTLLIHLCTSQELPTA